MQGPSPPTGSDLRERLAALDRDTRQHIAHEVRHGRTLRERDWALLAVSVARVRRREVLLVSLLLPGLVLLAVLAGTVGGRWARGHDPVTTAWLVLSWHDGLPWLLLWLAVTGALLVFTRSYRASLRRAEERNLRRATD